MSTESLRRLWAPAVAVLVLLAAAIRFWDLATRPGFEWDEAVYANIGTNLTEHGLLQAKTEYDQLSEPYLYHPPFYYLLLSTWFRIFGAGIFSARTLAVTGSLILLVLLAVLLRRLIGPIAALVAVGLLTVDGWMVFTNRVSWIENTMMPLGVAALWLYWRALQAPTKARFAVAGLALGIVAAYKHMGVMFLVAVLLHWLIVRRWHAQHATLLATTTATLLVYVAAMGWWFGQTFWRASTVQLARSLDLRSSRGNPDSFDDVIRPLLDQYKIYWLTVAMLAVGAVILIARIVQIAVRRNLDGIAGNELLFAWAAASMIFFAVLQLRFPHYLLMLIIPTYCYLVAEGRRWVAGASKRGQVHPTSRDHAPRLALVAATLAIVAVWGAVVFNERIVSHDDNALAQTAAWTEANLPPNAQVITEESVGTAIEQPYCKIYRANACKSTAQYLITYESHTQKPPSNATVNRTIAEGIKLVEIFGFKEHITVYAIPQPVSRPVVRTAEPAALPEGPQS